MLALARCQNREAKSDYHPYGKLHKVAAGQIAGIVPAAPDLEGDDRRRRAISPKRKCGMFTNHRLRYRARGMASWDKLLLAFLSVERPPLVPPLLVKPIAPCAVRRVF
jgi:hypothetical protein